MTDGITTYIPGTISVGQFHSVMLAAVGPRPIAFVSTVDAQGLPNLAPFSFFNVFGSNPATLIFSPARRGRDGTTKHTLHNAETTRQCVVNIVSFSMVEQMSLASTEFDEGVNEFVKAGFTEASSQFVRPPRVAEAPASFECEVTDIIKTGTYGGAGNLVICKILALHFQNEMITDDGKIDQYKMDLVGRMGYEYYCRANAASIFELPKPKSKNVIGFDGIPRAILESSVLTGNELARLANFEELPSAEVVLAWKTYLGSGNKTKDYWMEEGRKYLKNNEIENSWKCFLATLDG